LKKSVNTTGTKELAYSNLPIPPGEYLAEVLVELGLSQAELARRISRPAQAISEIVHGRKAITAQTALDLEAALQVPAYLWLNLEAQYQLALARQLRASTKLAS
jgi:HTH-type transcriptional regulator/antitoxin HigA